MKNNHLIYLVFGKNQLIYEAIYSILSYYKIHDEEIAQIHIFTDKRELFELHLPNKNFIFHKLDNKKQKDWGGKNDYIYRLKIKCLLEVCNLYKGNFIFLDADTVFRHRFDLIFEKINIGTLVMNMNEGKISTAVSPEFRRYIQFFKENKNVVFNKEVTVSKALNIEMWNSGVIGFNTENVILIKKSLDLCDSLSEKTKIRTLEQFAISYYFQQKKLINADREVFHYFHFKDFGNIVLEYLTIFSERNFSDKVISIDCIDPEILTQQQMGYYDLTFFQKTWRKITTGKRWSLTPYKIK